MTLSVLDLFLLSMLDRGAQSPYELQRMAGVSLGASVPSLRRLTVSKLVTRQEGTAATNRPRHEYKLTAAGKQAARTGWKAHFQEASAGSDLDSLLRIVDMAFYYGTEKKTIKSFLKQAAGARVLMAEKAGLAEKGFAAPDMVSYMRMRASCDAIRLRAEADALSSLAASIGSQRQVAAQQSLN
jgi:DNA-binding PadR family transcriptional regulator